MIEAGSLEIRWIQGFIKTNVEFVDETTACYGCGNHICFLNLETKVRSVFQSPGRGVGALTANGRSGTFAFSEQKMSPSIFVYTFPWLQLKNELKGDAQLDYTLLTFSDEGPYLGSCSSYPDYSITVWNWENAQAICTQSQAGQDVVYLVFNPLNWLQLCALSATTFTVWNVEKGDSLHVLKPRVIELPETDAFFAERQSDTAVGVSIKLPITGRAHCKDLRSTRARLTPSAICWTAASKLYVGCAEGYLLLVDPENFSVSVVFSPTTVDAIPELQGFSFQAFTLNENNLIAAGKANVLHCVQINGTQIDITNTWQLEKPVTSVRLSPDNETLLLSSGMGQTYLLNPSKSDEVFKILDVFSGNFLTAAFLQTDRNICVSLLDSGVLQLWSSYGNCLGFLHLQAKVTSLACCPIANYAAVGTESGRVLFIDLNKEEQPCLVHQIYLYHSAVDHLIFDQEGHYLFTGSSSDSRIYVIDAKPSAKFSVIGYMVISGQILSLSTQCPSDGEKVNVLVLCTEQEGKNEDSRLLVMASLPAQNIAGLDCVDLHGCLSPHVLKVFNYKVSLPLTSCTLGANEVFAYCQRNKSLQQLQLPEDSEDLTSQQVVQLKPIQEVKGHPLGPASVLLSPHCLWLASAGRDGLLRIRQTASLEQYVELWCHSCHLGGVRSVSFSSDGLTLLSTGFNDCSLVCTNFRIKSVNDEKVDNTIQNNHLRVQALKNVFAYENLNLADFCVWDEDSTKHEDSEVEVEPLIDATKQDEQIDVSLSAPSSNLTWLEAKTEEAGAKVVKVVDEYDAQHSEEKIRLMEIMAEISDTMALLEKEGLHVEQRNMDAEKQRLENLVAQETEEERAETEKNITEMCYHQGVLRECWDSWMVKSRAIKAFHSELIVQNYPLHERTQNELEDLRRVENMRRLEEAACTLSSIKNDSRPEDQNQEEEEVHKAESAALTGSFSAQLGFSNPYIYDQFSLQTIEQRINQAVLLQDVIYSIKMAFNTEFEAQHRQKLQELKRVEARNKRIREITQELNINQELWESSLTDSECPERLVTVDNSEIKASKYLTPEEERKKMDESHLAAEGDDWKEKGLDDMMDGVLEVPKANILKMEIPVPEFVLNKHSNHWSEEEKNIYKDYEKKTKDLNEEKQKHKRFLKIEMKNMQKLSKEETEKLDEMLTTLMDKKLECTIAIYQDELSTIYCSNSVLTEEEMRNFEQELKRKLESLLAYKLEAIENVLRPEHEVELFQEAYKNFVAETKVLEADFKKEFPDVPTQAADQLYKLFKRRPRGQTVRAQTANTSNESKEHRLQGPPVPDPLSHVLKNLEELDSLKYMPEGIDVPTWDKLCLMRKAKVECEHQAQMKAVTLAEMNAFVQRRKDHVNTAQQAITNCSEELKSLHNDSNHHLINTRIQVVLKQGQVEVLRLDPSAGNTSTNFLYHKRRVDKLRGKCRDLEVKEIAIMEKHKDLHRKIVQLEWKQSVPKNKIEDLKQKKSIKMLRLSNQQQDKRYCSKKEQAQNLAWMKKIHQQKVQQCQKRIGQIKQQEAKKTNSSESFEQQLPDLHMTVAEQTNICGLADTEKNLAAEREERYQEILLRKAWKETAISQAEELFFLSEEVERLTKKNYISLDELEHYN